MMSDLATADSLYRPTNYWSFYERHFLPELRARGLRDFRRRRYSVLETFGAVDLPLTGIFEPASSSVWAARLSNLSNRLANRLPWTRLGVHTYEPGGATEYFWHKVDAQFRELGWQLKSCATTLVGNPLDITTIAGGPWSLAHLQYCALLADAAPHLALRDGLVFCELGTGLGRNIEVLARLFPTATLVAFDIPPQLYVANQYLSAVFGDRVIGYAEAIRLNAGDRVSEAVQGKIVILPTWKLPEWSSVPFDLFWNSASFQEMEPDVVRNYLRLVLGMRPDAVYINAMPGGNYWGEWREGQGGTKQRVTSDIYSEVLAPDLTLAATYPTNYFLRRPDYQSYVFTRAVEAPAS